MATLDLASLKTYVTGGETRQLAPGLVLLDVEHSLIQQRFFEIPFDVFGTILNVKSKIYSFTGSKTEYQRVTLHRTQGAVVLEQDTRSLSSYGLQQGETGAYLRVEDLDPYALGRGGALHDTNLVQKYVMSDEDYGKRENTYRNFKQKQKALDPNWRPIHAKGPSTDANEEQKEMESEEDVRSRIHLGERCEIRPGGRRGLISYIGIVPEIPGAGLWIGVTLDEPLGKHDGMVLAKRYFTCTQKHGSFVRSNRVQIGDFPELDPFAELDDEEDGKQVESYDTVAESSDVYDEM